MHVNIRLQNHGCRNNPFWWIVIAPWKKNVKGRFIEHIGYWIPIKRKTVQRSVILNKQRALYWLAMGAHATPRIHRCLSYYDMMPKPLIKHGSKTIYEKPTRTTKADTMATLLPYRSRFDKVNLQRVIEQENENLLKREMMIANEATVKFQMDEPISNQEYNVEALEKEWNKLSAEVRQLEKDYKVIDPVRREQLIQRINVVAEQWKREKDIDEYKKFRNQYTNLTEKNLKKNLVLQNMIQKQEAAFHDKKEWFKDLKPMSEEELKLFLATSEKVKALKFDEQDEIFDEILNSASRTNSVITKFYINDYLADRQEKLPDIQDIEDKHPFNKGKNKVFNTKEFPVIITRVPVHPLPDITKYDPEDYTDIKKQAEQLNKNKAYSLPNVYPENDLPGSLRQKDLNQRLKIKAPRGRVSKFKSPPFFFSSGKQIETQNVQVEEEYFMELQKLRQLINVVM